MVSVKQQSLRLLFICLLATLSYIFIYAVHKFGEFEFYDLTTHFLIVAYYISSWVCCLIVLHIFNRYKPTARVIGGIFIVSSILFGISESFLFASIRLYNGYSTTALQLVYNYIFTLSLAHVTVSFFTIGSYYIKKNEGLIESINILEKNQQLLELKKLQRQLDPHFLFNNLNVLAELIRSNPIQAERFLINFSNLYRSFLKMQGQDLIMLKDELVLVKQYWQFIQSRFSGAYVLQIEPYLEGLQNKIVPGILLELVDNVIKHNQGNFTSPLIIKVALENNSVIVCNAIIPKDSSLSSNGMGLYIYKIQVERCIGQPLLVEIVNNFFIVKVPFLKD